MNTPKKGERVYRDFVFDRASIDQESRTVELAFSSELPYERWFGVEILDHSKKAIRLARLKTGAPLLLGHNPDRQIGVIEKVEIGSDKVGRATARFGKGALAEEIYQDVLDGIRSKVSVGYEVHEFELESEKDGQRTYRATDWEPFEVSIVSIPADNTVGVGREFEVIQSAKEKHMKTQEQIAAEAAAADAQKRAAQDGAATITAPPVDVRAVENAAREQERARVKDLDAIGLQFKQFGGEELSREAISKGHDEAWLRTQILERAGKPAASKTGDIGLTEKEKDGFSFLRAIRYISNPTDISAREAAGFEIECSRAAEKVAGKPSGGIMVPLDVLKQRRGVPQVRAQLAGDYSLGGALVDDVLETGSFIDLLRNAQILSRLGVRTLSGLVGDVTIPRQASASTTYWVGEAGAPNLSDITFGHVRMTPKTVSGAVAISRRLMIQSSLDIETLVRQDIAEQLALAKDKAGLYGIGSEYTPRGLKHTTGVQTVDFAADAPTFGELVDMETKIDVQNALMGNTKYIFNANMKGTLKKTQKVSGQDVFLIENNEVNGYGFEASNQIEAGDIWFGNWSDLLQGEWSGVDLRLDTATLAGQDGVVIRAFHDTDFAARRGLSFVRGNNTL